MQKKRQDDNGNGTHGKQNKMLHGDCRRQKKHKRERNDIKRGRLEITEPLTTDEENELHNLKDYDRWAEVTTDGKTTWRLRDPTDQQRYDELSNKDQADKGSVNFAETRLPPREYCNRRSVINNHGLGFVKVRYEKQPDTGFHYARIHPQL